MAAALDSNRFDEPIVITLSPAKGRLLDSSRDGQLHSPLSPKDANPGQGIISKTVPHPP